MSLHLRTSVLAVVGLTASLVALTGCSSVEALLSQQESVTYATVAEAREGGLDAPWLPGDATDIRMVRSTASNAPDAVVLVDSAAGLDPAVCAEVDRQSAPSYSIDGAPDVYRAETVYACGAWAVLVADGGWYGWTPSHPDEAAQAPDA